MVTKENEARRLQTFLSNNVFQASNKVEFFNQVRYAESYLPLDETYADYNRVFSRVIQIVNQIQQADETEIDYEDTEKQVETKIREAIQNLSELISLVQENPDEAEKELEKIEDNCHTIQQLYTVTK